MPSHNKRFCEVAEQLHATPVKPSAVVGKPTIAQCKEIKAEKFNILQHFLIFCIYNIVV
jgi:hypothetical protein